ncbi:hypothetical protein [Microbispora sp. KK1-11]|uniref:hypothetical protein n=1 Tax=Microbispora sp. KK1-11 TaxID=2053005 RepID=UPI00115C0166|nr:hypothetical protein [Microbispora sp. KK1-11]TQS30001.1 hypothetical protein FLW16_06470 [Microbispora sp. KK1-11]
MTGHRSNSDQVTGTYPDVTPGNSLDLFPALGVPSPELARRLVRMLNLPAVVERRIASQRSDAA